MAASYYRYFNDQPEKPYVSSPSPQEKWPPSEPAPFSNNKAIKHFPYQLISKQKHDYHYSVSIYDVKKEQWRRDGEERIWLFNQFDFLQRTSDYNVESIESIDNLMLMTSLDLRSIQKANSEKNAFSLGYNNVKAFFYQADVKYCK
ncbi:hypothetical protein ABT56_19590 [Photobacterium aquae]|uniref:Uncharacterized protein n=2 Tax=Photobacterium aquae TaxID=1195763 RepID=A0A0J1GUD6_9GAMM|nr:hypothetical protein ABT56_19590 [Photobacterium aquae]